MQNQIKSLFIGTPKKLDGHLLISSINRTSVLELDVQIEKIVGDQVANLLHHGGINRVLHQYPSEHYEYWKSQYPNSNFAFGSIGENLTSYGFLETSVCIGDVYQIGSVKCIVTEPRKPCSTINKKFGIEGMARKVQVECRTGWFYQIIESGKIALDDQIQLLEKPYPNLTIEKCIRALLIKPNSEILNLMIKNPILSANWRKPAQTLIDTGIIPDDRSRLGEK